MVAVLGTSRSRAISPKPSPGRDSSDVAGHRRSPAAVASLDHVVQVARLALARRRARGRPALLGLVSATARASEGQRRSGDLLRSARKRGRASARASGRRRTPRDTSAATGSRMPVAIVARRPKTRTSSAPMERTHRPCLPGPRPRGRRRLRAATAPLAVRWRSVWVAPVATLLPVVVAGRGLAGEHDPEAACPWTMIGTRVSTSPIMSAFPAVGGPVQGDGPGVPGGSTAAPPQRQGAGARRSSRRLSTLSTATGRASDQREVHGGTARTQRATCDILPDGRGGAEHEARMLVLLPCRRRPATRPARARRRPRGADDA